MKRRRQHRLVLAAAGLYNLAWGGWIALHPTALYHATGIPVPDHPQVAALVGMVIGLYGVLYLDAARRPENGWLIAAVGLLGKTLGPAAFLWHVTTGAWPADGIPTIVFNDLIWWLPFAIYLHDAWPLTTKTHAARD